MDDTKFWQIIAESRANGEECEAQGERLTDLLAVLPPDEIYDFDRHFARRRLEAYRWDLWAVAYIINGGCSNDGFEYFRCWLIGQGKEAFDAALAAPETVANFVKDEEADLECEDLLYAPDHAYERGTGIEMPPTDMTYPTTGPVGKQWAYEELESLYPTLWERF